MQEHIISCTDGKPAATRVEEYVTETKYKPNQQWRRRQEQGADAVQWAGPLASKKLIAARQYAIES